MNQWIIQTITRVLINAMLYITTNAPYQWSPPPPPPPPQCGHNGAIGWGLTVIFAPGVGDLTYYHMFNYS